MEGVPHWKMDIGYWQQFHNWRALNESKSNDMYIVAWMICIVKAGFHFNVPNPVNPVQSRRAWPFNV